MTITKLEHVKVGNIGEYYLHQAVAYPVFVPGTVINELALVATQAKTFLGFALAHKHGTLFIDVAGVVVACSSVKGKEEVGGQHSTFGAAGNNHKLAPVIRTILVVASLIHLNEWNGKPAIKVFFKIFVVVGQLGIKNSRGIFVFIVAHVELRDLGIG